MIVGQNGKSMAGSNNAVDKDNIGGQNCEAGGKAGTEDSEISQS